MERKERSFSGNQIGISITLLPPFYVSLSRKKSREISCNNSSSSKLYFSLRLSRKVFIETIFSVFLFRWFRDFARLLFWGEECEWLVSHHKKTTYYAEGEKLCLILHGEPPCRSITLYAIRGKSFNLLIFNVLWCLSQAIAWEKRKLKIFSHQNVRVYGSKTLSSWLSSLIGLSPQETERNWLSRELNFSHYYQASSFRFISRDSATLNWYFLVVVII